MSIDNVLKLIEDNEKLKISIQNISELQYELPYLMTQSLMLLDDNNYGRLKDTELKALCYMLDMYFGVCFYEFVEHSKNLASLIKVGKIEIYKVQAPNGLRYATENEVLHGIKGLIPEYIYPAGEDTYKKLCLLQWTFFGKSYYFRQVGFDLHYSADGSVMDTFWDLLQLSANDMKSLMDWIKANNLEKALKILTKRKNAGAYKYAQYESDEIEESITVKQLVYNILHSFPHNSTNISYRKALALAITKSKNTKVLSPYEISQLRKIYDEFALDRDRNRTLSQSGYGGRNVLKEECELIQKSRQSGLIDPNDFVFKIIMTLEKQRYQKCSPKQYKFIEEALNKINGPQEVVEETPVISEDEIDASLGDMYDALGSGLFEE